MDKIYYQPNHLWKGQKAVKKLRELSGEEPKAVKQWLSRKHFGKCIYQLLRASIDIIMK